MTAACNGAASTTKPGVPASVVVDQQFVQSLLPAALSYLYPYLPFMRGLQIGSVANFCAADPPTFTLPTPGQLFDFLTSGPISNVNTVNTFLQNITQAYLWQGLCKCVDNSVPIAPVAPANPGNLPAVNPSPFVALPTSVPCLQGNVLSPFVLPINQGVGSNTFQLQGYPITAVRLTANSVTSVGAGRTSAVRWQFFTAPNTNLLTICQAMGVNSSFSKILALPAGCDTVFTGILDDPTCGPAASVGSGTTTLSWNTEFFCGQAPGVASVPCCPPDPNLDGKLQALLNLLTSMQRFHVPFGYLLGAPHVGLSGTGAFAVSRNVGYQVTVTANPPTKRTSPGNPSYIFDLGWISVSDADGMIEEKRITQTSFLWFPRMGQLGTSFNYFLQSGVTVSVTEINPEAM